MKIILIIFLLTLNLFAQEVISVSRGSGSYVYDVATDTNQIVAGDLWLYGTYTRTLTDTGAYSFKPYIVWKYTGGSYDSSIALRIGNSFLIRILDPTLDATGTYYASLIYTTKAGNKIYDRGVDSTFTTPLTIVPPDTIPIQFTFHDSTGAEFATVVESNGVTLTGLDSAWCSAGGAEFKVNAGAWRTAGIKVYDDDVIYLRDTSSSVCTTAVNTTLTVGGIQDVFSITTKLDNTPNAFTFTDVTGAEASTVYTSNQFTLAGIYCNAAISINGGQFQIGTAAWRSSSTTVANGSLVRVRITSSSNYNTSVNSVLTIGGVSDTYTVTTRADTTPVAFTFTDITNAHLDSLHYSNGVALTSLDSCYGTAGLDTFKVGALGSWFVGITEVFGGDTIYLKNVSSADYSTAESMTFSAGGTSDTWSITTMADPTFTAWYVRPVTAEYGLENGTSWDNAFDGFADIAWGSIEPGDVLYIDGGTDSLIYYQTLTVSASGEPGNLITIRAGLDAGHNGRVIIDAQATRGTAINVNGGNTSGYLKFIKLEGRRGTDIGTFRIAGGDDAGQYVTSVYIDSCRVVDQKGHGAISIVGMSGSGQVMPEDAQYCDSIYIRWCYLKGREQSPSPAALTGEDVVFLQSSKNIFIYGNTIINNNEVTTEHSDAIQCIYMENVYVWHNWMYTSGPNPSLPNQVMMYESMRGNILLYGNVLYSPNQTSWMNNFIDKDDFYWKKYYVIHNVFYGGDDGDTEYNLFNVDSDTAYAYNNIFQNNVNYASETFQFKYPRSGFHSPYAWIDGNLFGDRLGAGWWGESITTINGWGAETIGTPSQRWQVDPVFVSVNRSGGDSGESADFHLQSSSPARDKGYNAQSLIESFNIPGLEWKDMDGVSLDSTPDIGAYQYVP